MQRLRARYNTPRRKEAFRVMAPLVGAVDPGLSEYLRAANFEITHATKGVPIQARIAHHAQTSLALISAPPMTIRWNRDELSRTRALLLFARVGALSVSGPGVVVRRGGTVALIPPGDTPVEITTTEAHNEFIYISAGAHIVPQSVRALTRDVEGPTLPWRTYAPLYAFVQAACGTQELQPGEPDMLAACADVIIDSGVQTVLSGMAEAVSIVDQVRAFIDEHHANPDLTPFSVADHFGVPSRTLQAAFAAEESTVRDELRLARSRTAMRLRETHPQMSQAQRAQLAGFASLSAMYRALQLGLEGTASADAEPRSRLRA